MENLLNNIKCPNCKSEFENYPIILNCGHTICKNCLPVDQSLNSTECPIDKVQTEDTNNLKENKIIKRILSILKLRSMNYLSLTKLSFSYCYNCKMFLSNFSSQLHYFVNHKIYSLSKYTFNHFLQIEKGSENEKINPFIQFYFNLYLFQKDNIFKDSEIKEIKENFPCNEDSYLFYGEQYEATEENRIFYNILKFVIQYDSNDKSYSLKKGYLISQKNDFKMNGFYVTYKQNYMIKAIGLVNFRETIFFGLITFTPTQINSGFFLINGILDDGKSFKIGKFNENLNEYPSYELETGEIINYNDSVIDVKRTILYAQQPITYNENFLNNIFFSCENNNDGSYKIIIKKKITGNQNIVFSFKNNKIEYIIFDYEEEQYIIIPLIQKENVVETHFSNCQINLKKKSISLLYNKEIKGFIIIKDSKKLTGYLFQNKKSNENGKRLFKKYCKFKIKHIVNNLEEIIEWFQEFFEINLKNLDITFRLFNQDLNPKKDSNYFKFDCEENRISDNEKTINKTIENLSDLSIYSILPDIYNNSLFQTIKEDLMKINFEKKKTTTSKDQCYIY
jgi:hypothetical protein